MSAPSPRKQAAAAAQAAVPTKRSINRQYGQSISDVEGFTTALAHLLQQGPSAQGAYNSAIQGQQGIDAAAQHALGVTGTPYAAGSQAAAAGLGTSALSALNARGAAAGAYGATLPHVAAARGTLGVQSLETARNQAIQQRNESYSQAFQQALQQARQNAEAMREFNVNTGLQRRQMSIQQRQFAAGQAYQYAALREHHSEFTASQRQQLNEFLAQQQQAIASAKKSGVGNFTPNEIASMARQGQQQADDFTTSGVPIQRAIQQLAVHMPLALAQRIALVSYANLTKPDRGDPIFHKTVNGQNQFNKSGYMSAMNAYRTAYSSWRSFLHTQRAFARQRAVRRNPKATNQRNPNPGGRG